MTKPKGIFKKRRNCGKIKTPVSVTLNVSEVPSTSRSIETFDLTTDIRSSASKTKIGDLESKYSEFLKNGAEVYDLVVVRDLVNCIFSFAVCKYCHNKLSFGVNNRVGLAASFSFLCMKCDKINSKYTNSAIIDKEYSETETDLYTINTRLVYGLRCIGRGHSAATTLCAVMNLPTPPSQYMSYTRVLSKAVESVCAESMHKSVVQAVEENSDSCELSVALDGTWQKRGHTSLVGGVTLTSIDTGCVLDVSILSKFCRCEGKLQNEHSDNCIANYHGVSGGMEVKGAQEIFARSEKLYGVKYVNYLGDGDSKAYESVVQSQPYGSDCIISKLECTGHVQKRMGTRLRKMKLKLGKTKLSDGKTIGGHRRLTDANILSIQKYYGLAIRRNANKSVQDMTRAIWAVYFHLGSNDNSPNHGLCDISWCKYRKAIAERKVYKHENHFHISSVVMLRIKEIFKDLSDPQLLIKCLHGKNQNCNESLNSLIWSRLPKTIFLKSLDTIKFGFYEAVSCFNQGNITKCLVFKKLSIDCGVNCAKTMMKLDRERVRKSERAVTELAKKARQRREFGKRKLEEELKEAEDPDHPSYGAGMH